MYSGNAVYFGISVQESRNEAHQWFERAAEQGLRPISISLTLPRSICRLVRLSITRTSTLTALSPP